MAEQSKNVSLWIPPVLLQELAEIAKKDERSRNWEIVQAIKAWVEQRKGKQEKPDEPVGF